MSNTLGIDFAEDTSEQMCDSGQRVKIGSRWIDCIASDERRTADITEESAVEVFEREVQILTASVSALPRQNSTVLYGSTRYYVYDLQNDTDGGTVLIYLRRNADARIV